MYNIGEVEKITGISKDRLRYYEEKGILNPEKSQLNQYREFSEEDILEVLSIEYYRSMDLGMKEIKQIKKQGEIAELSSILSKKMQNVSEEILRLQRVYETLQENITSCRQIQEHLNKYSIRHMPCFKILGELSDSKAFSEYDNLQNLKSKHVPIVKSMMRQITFSDNELETNRMLVVEEVSEEEYEKLPDENRIGGSEECLYTVAEEQVAGQDILQDLFQKTMLWLRQNQYKHQGRAIIRIILMTYKDAEAKSYLGIYVPVCRNK